MNSDLISREALKEAFKNMINQKFAGYRDFEKLIDNAPTVEIPTELCKDCRFLKDCETCEEKLRPQVECEKCDFRKFTETFVDGVVDVMNKNGITSVEQLSEILKGGADMRKEDKK